jgi:exosortase/archaeosortase family protein
MDKKSGEFRDIIIRYLILVLLPLGSLWIFYFIFTPLTIYPLFFLFDFFFSATLSGTVIYVNSVPVEMISACIAGSAYYLLLIFNLSTPGIMLFRRLKMIFFSFLIFLVANIIRIFFLTRIYMDSSRFFDTLHQILWYAGSTVLIIAIWFFQVKLYRIREIPFYSDIKFLYKHSLFRKIK